MKERKLTVKEIAALAGVNSSVIQNWLSGQNPHDLIAIDRLSQKLGVSFKKLLLGISEAVDTNTAISELYDESDLFEGLCRVKVIKLNPKKKE